MNFERLFQILSYAAVLCGFFSLWISGLFGVLGTGLFFAALIGGWFLERSPYQVSERLGTVLIVLALPVYYLLMRAGFFSSGSSESEIPGILARLIVTLSAIKLLQHKSDRDWIFLYIMSFFQVLLAAGLSISALYFASFISYVFIMVCTVILFEIRKADRTHHLQMAAVRQSSPPDDQRTRSEDDKAGLEAHRIPATAIVLIVFIIAIAGPMFFLLPRVGGAGFGGSMPGGAETSSGFSDSVRLGGIGRIQQNNSIVMRVRLEDTNWRELDDIRWRGIALDTFDNRSWRKSRAGYSQRLTKSEDRDVIQVDDPRGRGRSVVQTVYLDPINSPVIFVLPRAVLIQLAGSSVLRDSGGSLSLPVHGGERFSYRTLSETVAPEASALRRDYAPYSSDFYNYLQLPDQMDDRIATLAAEITKDATNRYDAARAVESYLQSQFGYTLEQKAGGNLPLSDFLFNVREGHCEYFATSMAIMLRTQGIATRIVNGFQRGDYNETANVFVVRQRNAHSWVEVYFPGENEWVTFDPTPAAGQNLTTVSGGITQSVNSYLEALEMFWIQYFVAYDSAEQRSLFTSVRRSVANYGRETSSFVDQGREALLRWWRVVRGDTGIGNSLAALGYGVASLAVFAAAVLLFVRLYRYVVKLPLWQRLRLRFFGSGGDAVIEFYERMQSVLASKGLVRQPHQTPLEFAYESGFSEAVSITEKYNRVRFGEKPLTRQDEVLIAAQLSRLKDRSAADIGSKE